MAVNSAPYEIVAQPFELWVAPVGTAFTLIDEDPESPWTKVGTSGALNYTEKKGVSVTQKQTVDLWRALGSTGPRKAFRTEEEFRVSLELADLTLEQYALALNHNTVTTQAAGAAAGYKKIGLSRGLNVIQKALLIRGAAASPYGPDWNAQFEVPIAVQVGSPSISFVKGAPAGIELEWAALEDASASDETERFGRLVVQNTNTPT